MTGNVCVFRRAWCVCLCVCVTRMFVFRSEKMNKKETYVNDTQIDKEICVFVYVSVYENMSMRVCAHCKYTNKYALQPTKRIGPKHIKIEIHQLFQKLTLTTTTSRECSEHLTYRMIFKHYTHSYFCTEHFSGMTNGVVFVESACISWLHLVSADYQLRVMNGRC